MAASPVAAATVQFNPEARLYIDGRLRESATGKTIDNINPATEEVLGVCTDAGVDDMEEAIAAARADTTDWSTTTSFAAALPFAVADALEEEKEDLRAELVAEVRRWRSPTSPTRSGRWPTRLVGPPNTFRNSLGERDLPDAALLGTPYHRKVIKEPMGVVGAITPWNFPFEIISNKVGQALATATPCCSSRRSRRHGVRCAGVASSPRRPTSPRES